MSKQLIITGAFASCIALPASAQSLVEVRNAATTTNVYAQQQIELLTGFETTALGFKAEIKLPEAKAGRWSAPLLWQHLHNYAGNTISVQNGYVWYSGYIDSTFMPPAR